MRNCKKCGVLDKDIRGHCRICSARRSLEYRTKYNAIANKTSRKYKRRGWAVGEHDKAESRLPFVTHCACCFSSEARRKFGWIADHNHVTGMFRGHICHPCNIILGFIEKYDIQASEEMAVYMGRSLEHV